MAFLWAKGSTGYLGARFDPLFCEPALVHFKDEANRFGRTVGFCRLRLHVLQVQDRSIVRNESGGQWQQGILHPKTQSGGALEDEKHALVLRHLFAEHQANLALFGRQGQLCVDLVNANGQRNALQLHLGRVLGAGDSMTNQEGGQHGVENVLHRAIVAQQRRVPATAGIFWASQN